MMRPAMGKGPIALATAAANERALARARSVAVAVAIAIATGIVLVLAAAQDARALEAPPQVEIVWTDTPPEIDGLLDDAVWQQAAVIDQFTQVIRSPVRRRPSAPRSGS